MRHEDPRLFDLTASAPLARRSSKVSPRMSTVADLATGCLPDTPELRKARGAFFTSVAVCRFMAAWAIRLASDRVLEPSCGEAAFLVAAVRRLQELHVNNPIVDGSEIHFDSARAAECIVREAGGHARVTVGDFLARPPGASYDAVIGNPPFVRYHGLTGESRRVALAAAAAQGVVLPQLTNSWAPFVVHAAAQLRPGGRLALVVPAELLTAGFAAGVRAFLLRRFKTVRLILSDTALFPGVLTDAILLLAEGLGPTRSIEIQRVAGLKQLASYTRATTWTPSSPRDRWVPSLVAEESTFALDALTAAGSMTPLASWGRVSLGAVTGNNRFFTLTSAEVAALELQPRDLVQISPPGSRHLRAVVFSESLYQATKADGARTFLFRPSREPSAAGREYIKIGERQGVQNAYKCRIRDPWWRPPLVPIPDLFLTYMNADTARLAANTARVHHLNSVHGVYLGPDLTDLAVPLAVASVNSATLLSAELTGRAYGGGILKLEPGEARLFLLPVPEVVRSIADELRSILPELKRALAAGAVGQAAKLVDQLVFGTLPSHDLEAIRNARQDLAQRRRIRGLSHSGRSVQGKEALISF